MKSILNIVSAIVMWGYIAAAVCLATTWTILAIADIANIVWLAVPTSAVVIGAVGAWAGLVIGFYIYKQILMNIANSNK